MTQEILDQVKEGIIPSNKDLQTAIDFYTDLEAKTKLMGEKYHLYWADVFFELQRLEGYKHSRMSNGKWTDK